MVSVTQSTTEHKKQTISEQEFTQHPPYQKKPTAKHAYKNSTDRKKQTNRNRKQFLLLMVRLQPVYDFIITTDSTPEFKSVKRRKHLITGKHCHHLR